MKDINIAITAASYSGNKGAAAMLQSSISQLKAFYGERLHIFLMSVYPKEDKKQCPFDFVEIIPAQPQRIFFLAFPLAVLYYFFSWCPPFQRLLAKNKMLGAYARTSYVIDEAGISFADSRGPLMNTYAFATLAIPLLLKVPVAKYAQSMGPFQKLSNRFLAKQLLPRLSWIGARGRMTYEELRKLGLSENISLVSDGAFTMPQVPDLDRQIEEKCRQAGFSNVVGLSVSSVLARKCKKAGIDYLGIMADFIVYLTGRGYQVFLFANAARTGSKHFRNNDLPVCDQVYGAYQARKQAGSSDRDSKGQFVNGLYWDRREMSPEEVRAYMGCCRLLVAARFHAMVFALSKGVPAMLLGWSHKYQEVMDQFGLGIYVTDYSALSLENLCGTFERLEREELAIRKKIALTLPAVQEESYENIRQIVHVFQELEKKQADRPKCQGGSLGLQEPDFYMGEAICCKMAYTASEEIRANAASGGLVTALLCYLLKTRAIDGAWVTKAGFTRDGDLAYQTGIVTSQEEIKAASSSVYLSIPMMKYIDALRDFQGKIALVLTPCMMEAVTKILENEPELAEKVILKIGLFCSGGFGQKATLFSLEKAHIDLKGAKRLYYRRGHWRGRAAVVYEDGSEKDFSYQRTICAYKNAGFFLNTSCLACKDHFARTADLSCGDLWLPQMKKEPMKYTGTVVRSPYALELLQRMQAEGEIVLRSMTFAQMLGSQKRALALKYGRKWNHRLARFLTDKNRILSGKSPDLVRHLPLWLVYVYMCLIRGLLSW